MNLRLLLPAMAGCGLIFASPAWADTKAGVDAWARGDFPNAVKEWEGPASGGDADAQFNLGQAYKWGKGVKQDLKKSELFFGKAAAQGHIEASDNYGLLLFDRGERAMALPYVRAASERGDPRAQYLLAIMHFNGDLVGKDWVRAYALMSLAQQASLPQAAQGLQQMDGHIPLAQRQQAVGLAQQLASEAEATRNRQFAADDLGVKNPAGVVVPPPVRVASAPVRRQPTPEEAVAEAGRVASGASPRSAGADYARPAQPQIAVAPAKALPPAQVSAPPRPATNPPPAPAPRPAAATPAANGNWRIQLGAFAVAANADALWAKVRSRPELAGHARIKVAAGAVTKLQAGGYSEESARAACRGLSSAGLACAPVRN